jgi:hypothetical protein
LKELIGQMTTYKPKWINSSRPLEPSYLDSYPDDASARPTGSIPTVRPTGPGIYEKPLDYIHSTLDMSPKSRKNMNTNETKLSSADKRLRDWEEKKRQFVATQRRADMNMRKTLAEHHRSAKYQVPVTKTKDDATQQQPVKPPMQQQQPIKPVLPVQASVVSTGAASAASAASFQPMLSSAPHTLSVQPLSPPTQQQDRAEAPSPSTPRGFGGEQQIEQSSLFGSRVESMYRDREERRSERKKQRDYMNDLNRQLMNKQKNANVNVVTGTHNNTYRVANPQMELPTTEPLGSIASKRLATNEYRAELDRQVQAKLNAARQKMASTSTTPSTTTLPKKSYGTTPSPRRMSPEDYRSALDSQVEAKLAALRREVEVENKMYGVSSNGNNPSLSAVPSYVQSSLETRTTSRSNMMAQQQQYQQQQYQQQQRKQYEFSRAPEKSAAESKQSYRAELDAQILAKKQLNLNSNNGASSGGMYAATHVYENKQSSAPLMNTSSEPPNSSRAAKAAQYKAELDEQIRAKSAASSNQNEKYQHFTSSIPINSRAHAIHSSGYNYALPTGGNGELEERLIVKQRQENYKKDLDRMVEMRREQELLDQQINKKLNNYRNEIVLNDRGNNVHGGMDVDSNNNILSQLGNHHRQTTTRQSNTGSAPQFGRGLNSMHSGQTEDEEYEKMKQKQYRLELETQMEEQKRRQQEITPRISVGGHRSGSRGIQSSFVSNNRGDYKNYQQQQYGQSVQHDEQQPSSSEFAGLRGLGQATANRNVSAFLSFFLCFDCRISAHHHFFFFSIQVRFGARHHIETETPEQLYELKMKHQYETSKKESYANELRQQILERKLREQKEKERIAIEDEKLSRKVHMAFEEESKKMKLDENCNSSSNSGPASSAPTTTFTNSPEVLPISSSPPVLSIPSSLEALNESGSPTGLVNSNSGDLQWKGFTRLKKKDSLDPQERDQILRKQMQQERTAEALREQIKERKRREKERQEFEKAQEEEEERRIERDRQELSAQFARQRALEKAKREKKETEKNVKNGVVSNSNNNHSTFSPKASARPTTAEQHINRRPAASLLQRSSSAPVESPSNMSEEHLAFRKEMQERQQFLERQLQQQQDLVKRMGEQMEHALQQQQQQQQAPKNQRRQWNLAQPAEPMVFASVDSQFNQPQESMMSAPGRIEPTFENGYNSYDDATFQEEFQKAYAMNAIGAVPRQSPQRNLQQHQQQSKNDLPPKPIPSAAPIVRAKLPPPVDPAFQSRPKIMNSLDERTLRNEVMKDGARAGLNVPQEDDAVREFGIHYDEYNNNILEESLSGRSKLVQMKESTSMHTWNDGPLPSAEPTLNNKKLPPRPTSSSPTKRSRSSARRSRNWEVEKSLASSSKLIFMKQLPSIDENKPTGGSTKQKQQRPGTAGSLNSTAPGIPPTTIVEEGGSSYNSSNSSDNNSSISTSKLGSSKISTTTRFKKEETVSDLPSIAWDEDAPPAHHPLNVGTDDELNKTPTSSYPERQQQQRFIPTLDTSIESNNGNKTSSPSMRIVADFLGVDSTSPHLNTSAVDNNVNRSTGLRTPSTPPREDFENSPSQFRVHTPTYEDIQAMEKTVGNGNGDTAEGGNIREGEEEPEVPEEILETSCTFVNTMENTFGKTFESEQDMVNEVQMGKNTMKYVEEMNRANIDGGKVTMHETVTGKKNTMGMTKQWQTLESIAL